MLTDMATENWYLKLPAGAKQRGELPLDTINRELTELAGRGWEVVTALSEAPMTYLCVVLKKETP